MEEVEDEDAFPSFPHLNSDGEAEEKEDHAKAEEEGDTNNKKKKRDMCWSGCGRPASVCLCAHLPPQPLSTSTAVVVLHHPHELRRNPLATLPLLAKSLLRCHPVPGRRLRLGSHPLLDSLHRDPSGSDVLFLFPGGEDIGLFAPNSRPPRGQQKVLIVFDGTWRQAKEMVAASLPFLEGITATRVSLIGEEYDEQAEGDSTFESELVLRKEPFKGCMSTMEAVARALRALEPDGRGAEVEVQLLSVLRAMVGFQSCHLKPMKPRPKTRTKKEMILQEMKINSSRFDGASRRRPSV